tara:strand:- start:174 stop:653 length:480 start_codon:yes stop_codon:yes gene_type:complete
MAGAKLTRSIGRKLSKHGEDEIFALYLKHGSVRKLLKNMPKAIGTMSHGVFYEWLKETAERWSKWQAVQEIRANQWAEEALEIVDSADPDNVQVARLRADTRKWLAEKFNRNQFGKPEVVAAIGIQIGDEFLSSLKEVERLAQERAKETQNEVVIEESP